MRRFFSVLLLSAALGAGLTLWVWVAPPAPVDPLREQYADVFSRFGRHAEDAYARFDDAAGLDILRQYDTDGLRILLQYRELVSALLPHLGAESVALLLRDQGERLGDGLRIFQPHVVAELYRDFGADGVRFVLDAPERAFLLREHGQSLMELARQKGPVMFDLVRAYSPEFLEVYYDDGFFQAIRIAGVEGLLAMRAYPGMAGAIFAQLGDEPRFAEVLRAYGYRQVIPILHHVAQFRETGSGQAGPAEPDADETPVPNPGERQAENMRRTLEHIHRKGQSFLRQFAVAPDGTVTRRPVMAFANVVEEALLGDAQYAALPPREAQTSECAFLYAALELLGLWPAGVAMPPDDACPALQSGLAAATSQEGIEGLLALDQDDGLLRQYGQDAPLFVAQYGPAGLRLLEQTDGAILSLARALGPDMVAYALEYGAVVLDIYAEFGPEALNAIRATRGAVIPYLLPDGDTIFQILEQPDGAAMLKLLPVFGEPVVKQASRYPDDFARLLFKYGRSALTALERYDAAIIADAGEFGDDVVFYAGRYGDPAFELVRQGTMGVNLLRLLPEAKLRDESFLNAALPVTLLKLLVTSPRTLHAYVGLLGETYLPVDARYLQVVFWMLLSLAVFSVFGWLYDLFVKRPGFAP